MVGTFVLYGMSFAAAFALFVGARFLAGSAFRVSDRLPPFGEAPPAGFERARPGARLAITLVGPLGVYVFAAFLATLGTLLGASRGPGTTLVGLVPGGPAATAGLHEGDRITTVGDRQIRDPADLRPALMGRAGSRVEVAVARDGREVRFLVALGESERLGVQLGPNREPIGLGRSVRDGIAYPTRS
jgi:membrane-associated protease RseP (regulator of RpoE activity)